MYLIWYYTNVHKKTATYPWNIPQTLAPTWTYPRPFLPPVDDLEITSQESTARGIGALKGKKCQLTGWFFGGSVRGFVWGKASPSDSPWTCGKNSSSLVCFSFQRWVDTVCWVSMKNQQNPPHIFLGGGERSAIRQLETTFFFFELCRRRFYRFSRWSRMKWKIRFSRLGVIWWEKERLKRWRWIPFRVFGNNLGCPPSQ